VTLVADLDASKATLIDMAREIVSRIEVASM